MASVSHQHNGHHLYTRRLAPLIDSSLTPMFTRTRITQDTRSLPAEQPTPEADDKLFEKEPWVCSPIRTDYGVNIILGEGVFVNHNSTFIDTCPIRIGARTLIGPSCSFYSGTHPLDPVVRNGLLGTESGEEINIGEDCWLGGNVIVLPGVTIGRGCTIGAGSVVTKVKNFQCPW